MASTETLPSSAAGAAHKPYVADDVSMPELTISALLLGSSLGIIFAASSLYLVLKVGMTVSASIPVSVLAITLFRAFSNTFGLRRATILENNIVQTSGSAGESIAFGVGVTMPALMILGFQMDVTRVMVVSILGGLLGILAMIPLRRAFIVKMHGRPGQPGTLLFPEGTACAQVLISGEKGGTTGKTVFIGFGIAFLHKFLTEGMNLLVGTVKLPIQAVNRSAVFAGEMASELLGVGYIIGLRTSAIMMSGAVLGYLVLIPLMVQVGDAITEKPVPPGEKLISEMSLSEIRNNYLLFIGAGCVATAGIISMIRTLPLIARSIQAGLRTVRAGGNNDVEIRRTENDMSMRVVLLGSLGLVVLLAFFLMTQVGVVAAIAGALLVVLFGFLFVTVSTRLTGEIGSSSNPISGMTVATLTLTCLIFVLLGWTSSRDRLLALSIAAVVCVAASNGGTTAQSLKTGFLVGGTPRAMQYAILIGALASALVIGATLVAFNKAGTVFSRKKENLPGIVLTKDEMAKISERFEYEGKSYLLWDSRRDYEFNVGPERKAELNKVTKAAFLVDPETGKPEVRKDDTIMGKLKETDDGQPVKRDFDAPKTQVMGIIIDGVLSQKLNWSLVLMGALIALMLELAGVSALAFAVGLYVPIQYSTPIFLGGLLRWGVDNWNASKETPSAAAGDDPEARARAEIEAIRKAETSPGVLLAAGYIAGGSLAGMLLAFTQFSDTLPGMLSQWQYSRATLTTATEFKLLPKPVQDLNKDLPDVYAPVKKGTKVLIPKKEPIIAEADTTLGDIAKTHLQSQDKAPALMEENVKALIPEVVVPRGTILRIYDKSREDVRTGSLLRKLTPTRFETLREVTLADLAREALEDAEKAELIYAANEDELKLPEKNKAGVARLEKAAVLPEGAVYKLPQKTSPTLICFALLMAFMVAVGIGLVLRQPEEESANAEP